MRLAGFGGLRLTLRIPLTWNVLPIDTARNVYDAQLLAVVAILPTLLTEEVCTRIGAPYEIS